LGEFAGNFGVLAAQNLGVGQWSMSFAMVTAWLVESPTWSSRLTDEGLPSAG